MEIDWYVWETRSTIWTPSNRMRPLCWTSSVCVTLTHPNPKTQPHCLGSVIQSAHTRDSTSALNRQHWILSQMWRWTAFCPFPCLQFYQCVAFDCDICSFSLHSCQMSIFISHNYQIRLTITLMYSLPNFTPCTKKQLRFPSLLLFLYRKAISILPFKKNLSTHIQILKKKKSVRSIYASW